MDDQIMRRAIQICQTFQNDRIYEIFMDFLILSLGSLEIDITYCWCITLDLAGMSAHFGI